MLPAKTAAERMRLYRRRMSHDKKIALKERNKQQQNECRSKWDNKKRKAESVKITARKRKMRKRSTESETPTRELQREKHSAHRNPLEEH